MYCLGEGFVQTPVSEAEEKINEGEAADESCACPHSALACCRPCQVPLPNDVMLLFETTSPLPPQPRKILSRSWTG